MEIKRSFWPVLIGIAVLVFAVLFAIGTWIKMSAPSQAPSGASTYATPAYLQELQNETKALLLGRAEISFPSITKRVSISSSSLPTELQIPSPAGAQNFQYAKVQYQKQSGYYISYYLASSSVQSVWMAVRLFASNGWQPQPSGASMLLAFREYRNATTGDSVRLTFTQQGSGVQVFIQTLSKP